MICPVCHFDVQQHGWLVWRGPEGPDGKGNYRRYGDMIPCQHNEQVVDKTLAALCGLRAEEQSVKLGDYWPITGREKAVKAAQAMASQWTGMLGLQGGPGCGKSRLLMALANEARVQRYDSLYCTLPSLLEHLRSTYNSDTPGTSDLLSRVSRVKMLCIDELDKPSPTPWVVEKFATIMDERYRGSLLRATAVAFNDAEKVPNYILSRLREYGMIQVTCGDIRPRLKELRVAMQPVADAPF